MKDKQPIGKAIFGVNRRHLGKMKRNEGKKQMKEKRIGGSREGAGRFKIIKQLPVFYQILMFYVFKRSVVAMFDDGE